MDLKIHEMPFGKRTNNFSPDLSLYKYLGEKGIRKLVSNHYDLLVNSEVKDLFPPKGKELEEAKIRSADFFIQRLGGPDYYSQKRGKPMLSRRHAPFNITPKARIVWLDCYRQILKGLNVPDEVIISYWNWLNELSNWMVNTLDGSAEFHYEKKDQ